ncbi:MAG: AAA family ATPase [Syntrophobacterales bacterium]|nr:AAA family ATPase [Syntrophobacterales bacterium]
MFLGVLVTIIVVTLAVAFLSEPIYKVTGNILVKPMLEQAVKLMAPPAAHLSTLPVRVQEITSEVSILQSTQLLSTVVKELDLTKPGKPKSWFSRAVQYIFGQVHKLMVALGLSVQPSPEDQAILALKKKLSIKPIPLSNVIEISLSGESPEMITKIVNSLMRNYVEYHVALYRPKGAREFYAEQAQLFADRLKGAEDDLEKFKKEWSIIEITAQNDANIELLRMLRENLALVQANISDRQTKVGAQKRNLKKTGEVGAFTKDMQSGILEELVRNISPLLVDRERIAVHYQKSSLKYQAINRQVEELKRAYNRQIKDIVQGNSLDLSGLNSYGRVLQQDISEVETKSLLLSEKQVEYDRLMRELKQFERNYLLYLNKTEEARIEEQQDASRASNVTVTNWAKIPSVPIFPRKFLMAFLSLVIGAFVGVAGAFSAYYMDHTVKTPEDIIRTCRSAVLTFIPEEVRAASESTQGSAPQSESQDRIFSKLPSGGGIPYRSGQVDVPLWMAEPRRYPELLESYRTLKTHIRFLERFHPMAIIQVTAANRQAGASTTACNLALEMACDLLDHRILLVDANLANPAVHQTFGLSKEPGLLNCLTEELELQQVVQPTFKPNLEVMAVGKAATQVMSPFDLLKFTAFLDEVRQRYTYVVIDSAPILVSSDSLNISTKVDGVILVAEANRTRFESIASIEHNLKNNARLLGIVLNKRRFVIPKMLYNII